MDDRSRAEGGLFLILFENSRGSIPKILVQRLYSAVSCTMYCQTGLVERLEVSNA